MTIDATVAKHMARMARAKILPGPAAMESTRRIHRMLKDETTRFFMGIRASSLSQHEFREYYIDSGFSPLELYVIWHAYQR